MAADSFIDYFSVFLYASQSWGWLKASNWFWIFSSSLSWNHLYSGETWTPPFRDSLQFSAVSPRCLPWELPSQVNLLPWKTVCLWHLGDSTKIFSVRKWHRTSWSQSPVPRLGSHSLPLALHPFEGVTPSSHCQTAALSPTFSLETGLRDGA